MFLKIQYWERKRKGTEIEDTVMDIQMLLVTIP